MIWLLALQLALGPQQHYEDAKRDLAQMHFDQAAQEVDSALHLDPYFVPALTLKARLALFAHRPDIARSCLITAITVDPKSENAQFLLGVFQYLQNDFKLAIPPLEAARLLNPKDPLPVFYLALSKEALGDAPAALQLYQQAEDLSPEKTPQTASILVAYGRLLDSLGRYEESIAKDQLAIAADGQSRDAHYELARGLDHRGVYATAAAEGERALTLPALGTSDSQIHFLLGNIYLKMKKFDLSEAHLAKFAQLLRLLRDEAVREKLIKMMCAESCNHQSHAGSTRRFGWICALWLLVFCPVHAQRTALPNAPSRATSGVQEQTSLSRDGYVGNEACRSCHAEIVKTYLGSAHDRTSRLAGPDSIAGKFSPDSNILRTSNPYLYFVMNANNEGYFQTAVAKLPAFQNVTRTERFDLVIGSNRKGQTYLSWKDDKLYELPVSYWTESGHWINSPGYPDGSPNFDKPIVPRCLECHSTYFDSLPPPLNRFSKNDAVLGITCEKCHGPGREHIAMNRSPHPPHRGEPEAVINPASFSRDRQMDLCAWCHAGAGIPIVPSFSYTPGKEIDKYLSGLDDHADEQVDVHGHQVQLLKSSRCFRSSTMTCTTCHDVHLQQRDAAAFSPHCLACHKAQSCGEYAKIGPGIVRNCVDCHMPLQKTSQIFFDSQGERIEPRIRSHRIAIYTESKLP